MVHRLYCSVALAGLGDNFTNTILDDEALTPIASGTPRLRAGICRWETHRAGRQRSTGTWKLEVVDAKFGGKGTLVDWSSWSTTRRPPRIPSHCDSRFRFGHDRGGWPGDFHRRARQPGRRPDVVIPVSSSDTTEGTCRPGEPYFHAGNWKYSQNGHRHRGGRYAHRWKRGLHDRARAATSIDPDFNGIDPAACR